MPVKAYIILHDFKISLSYHPLLGLTENISNTEPADDLNGVEAL